MMNPNILDDVLDMAVLLVGASVVVTMLSLIVSLYFLRRRPNHFRRVK